MARVYLTTSDPVVHYIYDEKACIDYFGEDHLADYGTDIPDELLQEYKKAYLEFFIVQEKLDTYIRR